MRELRIRRTPTPAALFVCGGCAVEALAMSRHVHCEWHPICDFFQLLAMKLDCYSLTATSSRMGGSSLAVGGIANVFLVTGFDDIALEACRYVRSPWQD
jgi:hypothetical protein